MEPNRYLLEQADRWQAEGRIDAKFHEWLRKTYRPEPPTKDTGRMQQVLSFAGAILALVGIITLVTQFWDAFTDDAKQLTLVAFAFIAAGLGYLLSRFPSTLLIGQAVFGLIVPLYLFSMSYAESRQFIDGPSSGSLTPREAVTLIGGILLSLAALALGARFAPALAATAPSGLLGSMAFLFAYLDTSGAQDRAIAWTILLVGLLLQAGLLAIQVSRLGEPYRLRPWALRIAAATLTPWVMAFIWRVVEMYHYPTGDFVNPRYDEIVVTCSVIAVYLFVLLAVAVRNAFPEVTLAAGLGLVVDAIILGADKGDLVGTAIAILTIAVVLLVLAQQGILQRVLRAQPAPAARPIPTASPPARRAKPRKPSRH